MGTAKTCLLFFTIHLIYAISAQEKRVPDGFVGTRGKKSLSDAINVDHYYKRKPQFFVGVKGKKNFIDGLADDHFKRAPMGFVGMRGKKEYDPLNPGYNGLIPRLDGSLFGKIDYTANDDFQNDDYIINNFIDYLQETEKENLMENLLKFNQIINAKVSNDESGENDVDKRAANVHQFYGVRGKKAVQKNHPYDLTFRGKFIGVRGKKDLKDDNSGEKAIKFLLDQEGPWPKRRTQMGFFGMRGKKWTDESSPETPMDVYY